MRRRHPSAPEAAAPAATALTTEPRLPIEPPWWVLPLSRRGPVRPRPEPRPFDYAACLARLEQAKAGGTGPSCYWNLTEEEGSDFTLLDLEGGMRMAGPLLHPVLGPLDWDEMLAWWIAKVELKPDHPIELFISGEGDPPEAILTRVPPWLERIRSEEFRYRRWTAEQCADGRWNSEEVMTIEDITALLRLAAISFEFDGTASLCWDDQGRLYGEHNLLTDLDADGNCTQARITG